MKQGMSSSFPLTWEEAVLWLRAQPEQQELVRACFFDDPLLAAAERYHASTEWRAVRKLLPASPGQVLDVGAGRGIAAFALSKDGWVVTALEPDSSALVGAGAVRALAEQSGLPICVVEEWGESLPFPDASFDAVHARQVLHHARDLRALCMEVARVLRPGGVFIATREHVVDSPADLPSFFAGHPLHRLYGGENAFALKEYMRAMHESGLRLCKAFSPWESDVNLFPETKEGMRLRLRKKLFLPLPACVLDALLGWKSKRLRIPGRLYTFVSERP